MSYLTSPATDDYNPIDELPQHLAHKPVYALPYQFFDGGTDMRFLSVGIFQDDPEQVSIKTMRHTGTKWSRQAEELPLHRTIDMALFLAKVIFDRQNGAVILPSRTLHNQDSEITIFEEEARDKGEMLCFNAAVDECEPLLRERFNALLIVLNDLKTRGRI